MAVKQISQRNDFTVKPCQSSTVVEQVIRKELERHWLAQFQIFRPVDFAHASFPKQPNDAITLGQDCPCYKTRIVDRVK